MENEYSSLITGNNYSIYTSDKRYLEVGEDQKVNVRPKFPKGFQHTTVTTELEGAMMVLNFTIDQELLKLFSSGTVTIDGVKGTKSVTSLCDPITVDNKNHTIEIRWSRDIIEILYANKIEESKPEPGPGDDKNWFYVENDSKNENELSIYFIGTTEGAPNNYVFEYSEDTKTWNEAILNTSGENPEISIIFQNKLYLRCKTNIFSTTEFQIRMDCVTYFNVGGNILSLVYGENFTGKEKSLPAKGILFKSLFEGNSEIHLLSAKNLILPVQILSEDIYSSMFSGCNELTEAPELPAMNLASRCYSSMFQNCTSLTEAPELPATTLLQGCYYNMFYGCSSLQKVSVGFSDWGASSLKATMSWLRGVKKSGVFLCPSDLPIQFDASHIPPNWQVNPGPEPPTPGDYTIEDITSESGVKVWETYFNVYVENEAIVFDNENDLSYCTSMTYSVTDSFGTKLITNESFSVNDLPVMAYSVESLKPGDYYQLQLKGTWVDVKGEMTGYRLYKITKNTEPPTPKTGWTPEDAIDITGTELEDLLSNSNRGTLEQPILLNNDDYTDSLIEGLYYVPIDLNIEYNVGDSCNIFICINSGDKLSLDQTQNPNDNNKPYTYTLTSDDIDEINSWGGKKGGNSKVEKESAKIGYFYNVTEASKNFEIGLYVITSSTKATSFDINNSMTQEEFNLLGKASGYVAGFVYYITDSESVYVAIDNSTASEIERESPIPPTPKGTGWTPSDPIDITGTELEELLAGEGAKASGNAKPGYFYNVTEASNKFSIGLYVAYDSSDVYPFNTNNSMTAEEFYLLAKADGLVNGEFYYITDEEAVYVATSTAASQEIEREKPSPEASYVIEDITEEEIQDVESWWTVTFDVSVDNSGMLSFGTEDDLSLYNKMYYNLVDLNKYDIVSGSFVSVPVSVYTMTGLKDGIYKLILSGVYTDKESVDHSVARIFEITKTTEPPQPTEYSYTIEDDTDKVYPTDAWDNSFYVNVDYDSKSEGMALWLGADKNTTIFENEANFSVSYNGTVISNGTFSYSDIESPALILSVENWEAGSYDFVLDSPGKEYHRLYTITKSIK